MMALILTLLSILTFWVFILTLILGRLLYINWKKLDSDNQNSNLSKLNEYISVRSNSGVTHPILLDDSYDEVERLSKEWEWEQEAELKKHKRHIG